MNILTFKPNNSQLIYSQNVEDSTLEVRDFQHYRFFTLSGDIVHSVMNKQYPQQIVSPVCQAMLLFLLWKHSPLNILNLGAGGASFERYFKELPSTTMTSVDSCPHVIAMAKKYFNLTEQANIHCQSAEKYLQANSTRYDIVLCDIFSSQNNVDSINKVWFYDRLSKSVNENGLVSINLDPVDKQYTLNVLQLSRQYFSNVAIIEFKDYKNIILLLSQRPIPDREFLFTQNKLKFDNTGIQFNAFISAMHYLPAKKLYGQ